MKAKKIILSSLAVASAGALAAGVYKIAKDQKRLRTQEELVADERHYRFVYEDGLLHYEEEKL